jgi:hypothetical protein
MAEQIPEAWIGEEVTVGFGPEDSRRWGTLRSVTERGLVVDVQVEGGPVETYYPIGSVHAMSKGRPPNARPSQSHSF